MYECHITVALTDGPAAAAAVAKLDAGWKTSEIARDPILGDETYFYLTCHADTWDAIRTKMNCAVFALGVAGCPFPIRLKVEHIVYDTKTGIGMEA